jgi:hypothetical protein
MNEGIGTLALLCPEGHLVGHLTTSDSHGGQLAIDMRVVVYPGTNAESDGIVVDDFGSAAGYPVDIAGTRIVGPARRWAVSLDSGELVFVDSDSLAVK